MSIAVLQAGGRETVSGPAQMHLVVRGCRTCILAEVWRVLMRESGTTKHLHFPWVLRSQPSENRWPPHPQGTCCLLRNRLSLGPWVLFQKHSWATVQSSIGWGWRSCLGGHHGVRRRGKQTTASQAGWSLTHCYLTQMPPRALRVKPRVPVEVDRSRDRVVQNKNKILKKTK